MPASAAERTIRLMGSYRRPDEIAVATIDELNLTVTSAYDAENDALGFDFGLDEPTFDLPDSDGQMVWRIGRETGSVAGFLILGAKKIGASRIHVNFDARRESIQQSLKREPAALASGRVTRALIQNVEVSAQSANSVPPRPAPPLTNAVEDAVRRFEEQIAC